MGDEFATPPRTDALFEELTRLFEVLRGACLRLAAATVRDLSLAEEVVQESFLAAWQHAPLRYDPRRGSLESWILTLTRHKAVDAVRRAEHVRRVQRLEGRDPLRDSAPESPEDLVLRGADDQRLRLHLDGLPPPQQRVLLLMYWYGLSQMQISTTDGTPLGTVKSRTTSAMQRLRNSMTGEA